MHWDGGAGLRSRSSLRTVLAAKVCACCARWRPSGRLRTLAVALWRAGSGLEQSTRSSPQVVRDFLRLKLCQLEHEVFAVVHLDSQHQVLEYVEMFHGTVSQTSVYPREVVKEALARNSACANPGP